jgi:hypothetical protein
MKKYDFIGDIRGIGLMQVMELVSDRETKAPLAKAMMSKLLDAIYQENVMVRVSGNNVIMSPPLIIDSNHVAKIIAALDTGLGSL